MITEKEFEKAYRKGWFDGQAKLKEYLETVVLTCYNPPPLIISGENLEFLKQLQEKNSDTKLP